MRDNELGYGYEEEYFLKNFDGPGKPIEVKSLPERIASEKQLFFAMETNLARIAKELNVKLSPSVPWEETGYGKMETELRVKP